MMTLRDYQIDLSKQGCAILRQHGIVYYAMQVRTGKTLTALNTAALYGAKNVLFLTKKKAIPSIQKDYDNFQFTYNIHITNYEQLGKFNFKPDLIIADESHGLSAYPKPSNRAKNLKQISAGIPIIYLSGTPTPEGYSQIYHQLWISSSSPYKSYYNFYKWAADYVNVKKVRHGNIECNDYSDARGERIKKDIEHLMLTYTQEEAKFFCPIYETIHEVEDNKIPGLIKKIWKDKILQMCGGFAPAETGAALMSKMHQISGGSLICSEFPIIFSDAKIAYIKEKFVFKRIAIYYKFKMEREIILMGYPDATESPEDFQSGKSDTFISQIVSGREGITLWSADAIVFYSIDYSATSYFQARARLQDLQRRTLANVHWIFTKGGIEKKVYEAVTNKIDFTYGYFKKLIKQGNLLNA